MTLRCFLLRLIQRQWLHGIAHIPGHDICQTPLETFSRQHIQTYEQVGNKSHKFESALRAAALAAAPDVATLDAITTPCSVAIFVNTCAEWICHNCRWKDCVEDYYLPSMCIWDTDILLTFSNSCWIYRDCHWDYHLLCLSKKDDREGFVTHWISQAVFTHYMIAGVPNISDEIKKGVEANITSSPPVAHFLVKTSFQVRKFAIYMVWNTSLFKALVYEITRLWVVIWELVFPAAGLWKVRFSFLLGNSLIVILFRVMWVWNNLIFCLVSTLYGCYLWYLWVPYAG